MLNLALESPLADTLSATAAPLCGRGVAAQAHTI